MRFFATLAAALALRVQGNIGDDLTADSLATTCNLGKSFTKEQIFDCVKIYAGVHAFEAVKGKLLENQSYNKAELAKMIAAIKAADAKAKTTVTAPVTEPTTTPTAELTPKTEENKEKAKLEAVTNP